MYVQNITDCQHPVFNIYTVCAMQSEEQLAHVAAKAGTHDSSICALLLMQKESSTNRATANVQLQPRQGAGLHHGARAQSAQLPGASGPTACDLDTQPNNRNHEQTATLKVMYQDDSLYQHEAMHADIAMHQRSSSNQPGFIHPQSPTAAVTAEQPKRARQDQEGVVLLQPSVKRQKLQHNIHTSPPSQQQLQQQQQSQQQQHAQSKSWVSQAYGEQIIASMLAGIQKFGMLCNIKHLTEALPATELDSLTAQPLLQQLLHLSMVATNLSNDCSLRQLFQDASSGLNTQNKSLLLHRQPSGTTMLCSRAQKLFDRLSTQMFWPCNASPDKIAQAIPANLQPAYILCIAGYAGPTPLTDFAAHVMHHFQLKLDEAVKGSSTAQATQSAVVDDAEHALSSCRHYGLSPQLSTEHQLSIEHEVHQSHSPTPVADQHIIDLTAESPENEITYPQENVNRLAVDHICRIEAALLKLGYMHIEMPAIAFESLLLQSGYNQLIILSVFCTRADYSEDPVTNLCMLCNLSGQGDLANMCMNAPRNNDRTVDMFLTTARARGVFHGSGACCMLEDLIFALPQVLQCYAACYAVGMFLKADNDKQALAKAQRGINQMHQLYRTAQLAKP